VPPAPSGVCATVSTRHQVDDSKLGGIEGGEVERLAPSSEPNPVPGFTVTDLGDLSTDKLSTAEICKTIVTAIAVGTGVPVVHVTVLTPDRDAAPSAVTTHGTDTFTDTGSSLLRPCLVRLREDLGTATLHLDRVEAICSFIVSGSRAPVAVITAWCQLSSAATRFPWTRLPGETRCLTRAPSGLLLVDTQIVVIRSPVHGFVPYLVTVCLRVPAKLTSVVQDVDTAVDRMTLADVWRGVATSDTDSTKHTLLTRMASTCTMHIVNRPSVLVKGARDECSGITHDIVTDAEVDTSADTDADEGKAKDEDEDEGAPPRKRARPQARLTVSCVATVSHHTPIILQSGTDTHATVFTPRDDWSTATTSLRMATTLCNAIERRDACWEYQTPSDFVDAVTFVVTRPRSKQ
jgi:hypothetical protein